ncbi:unnamed protein product [Urochloa humidicola]
MPPSLRRLHHAADLRCRCGAAPGVGRRTAQGRRRCVVCSTPQISAVAVELPKEPAVLAARSTARSSCGAIHHTACCATRPAATLLRLSCEALPEGGEMSSGRAARKAGRGRGLVVPPACLLPRFLEERK